MSENPQVPFPPPACLGCGHLCVYLPLTCKLMRIFGSTWKDERREEIEAPPINGEVQ